MKKYLFLAIFLLIIEDAPAQNQGTNLYLTLSLTDPTLVVKNVYKYYRTSPNRPRMKQCGFDKLDSGAYFMQYPVYYGHDLKLTPKQGATIQTISISQIASLYPTARTAAQLDLDMQPAIDYDYANPIDPYTGSSRNTHSVGYLRSFDKIYVIEHLPNGTAKVVECEITTRW